MSIYFRQLPSSLETPSIQSQRLPAHETIGGLYSEIYAELTQPVPNQEKINNLFGRLGVDPSDKSAIKEMSALILALHKTKTTIACIQSGVFKISTVSEGGLKSKDVVAYKIGSRRCAQELASRRLALLLGLEKHIVPAMFGALENPPLDETEEDATEALWNGNQKVFSSKKTLPAEKKAETPVTTEESSSSEAITPSDEESWDSDGLGDDDKKEEIALSTVLATVGIVQPYLSDQPEASVYEYVLMTMAALAIGLRDGKKDGYKGSMMFDVEDVFPCLVNPKFNSEGHMDSPGIIHLPYLDRDPRTDFPLSPEELKSLVSLVIGWNVFEITTKMSQLNIIYEDTIAEQQQVELSVEDEQQVEPSVKDEGGCFVKIEKSDPHEINGVLNILCPENPQRRIFISEQNEATLQRLDRIKNCILKCARKNKPFTARALVDAVDPAAKEYRKQLEKQKSQLYTPEKIVLETTGAFHFAGKFAPTKVRKRLLFEDQPGSEEGSKSFEISSQDCGLSASGGFGRRSDGEGALSGSGSKDPQVQEEPFFSFLPEDAESDTEK